MATLEGKEAIVTGTSRGVGVGIARALLEAAGERTRRDVDESGIE